MIFWFFLNELNQELPFKEEHGESGGKEKKKKNLVCVKSPLCSVCSSTAPWEPGNETKSGQREMNRVPCAAWVGPRTANLDGERTGGSGTQPAARGCHSLWAGAEPEQPHKPILNQPKYSNQEENTPLKT